MENNPISKKLEFYDDEIDLQELFKVLWNDKWKIISISALFSLFAIFYSLSLPDIYQSKAILSPVSNQNVGSVNTSGLSGLATLAGVDVSSKTEVTNTDKALEKLTTLSFFGEYIYPNIFLPDLMAFESWSPETNTRDYNGNIYDRSSNKWVRNFKFPQTQTPSIQESFDIFVNNHLEIKDNDDSGFIIISIKHQSPFIANAWLELIVKEINNSFIERDKSELEASLEFLNKQISQTSLFEVKQVIAQLAQRKIQQLTVMEVSDFYIFEYVDPPVVMEKKYGPRRSLICFIAALIGGILGIIYVLLFHYIFKNKN